MRTHSLLTAIALLCLMPAEYSRAGDAQSGAYLVVSPGSCGTYVDARKNNDWFLFGWWLNGYITAANALTPNTYNYLGNSDIGAEPSFGRKSTAAKTHCRFSLWQQPRY